MDWFRKVRHLLGPLRVGVAADGLSNTVGSHNAVALIL
jgi:hypothetical protein